MCTTLLNVSVHSDKRWIFSLERKVCAYTSRIFKVCAYLFIFQKNDIIKGGNNKNGGGRNAKNS